MNLRFVRTTRTPSSERYVLQNPAGEEEAALELHYLTDGRATGTLILLGASKVADHEVADLLKQIDETLLPDVSFEEGNLSFTVVRGTLTGSYVSVKEPH